MEIIFENESPHHAFSLLSSLIVPRPIAWVTSVNLEGKINAAPYSLFNLLGVQPPILGLCPENYKSGLPKDTARNIRDTHEFVVNLVDEESAQAMNITSAALPYGENELELANVETLPSSIVKPPRIAQAPASLECLEWGTLQIGENRLIIGLIKRLHVRDEYYDSKNNHIKSASLKMIGRMAPPNTYCRTMDRFTMIKPEE
ncbi:MAG: flavin reductase family protein [Verrucomicrobia bacterium]|nr:flavin reductase family protein [Verrucomicrobiota bacterium]